MSIFVIFCAAMALLAIGVVVYPLVRPVPVARKDEAPLRKANAVAIVLALAVPVLAASLYAGISNFPWNNPAMIAALPRDAGTGDADPMAQVTAALEQRLAQNPGDAEGWRLLGRTYLMGGSSAKAMTAYEKAAQLLPEKDPELELDIAEAMILGDEPALQPRAKEIVDAALAADGNSQKALWYSGVIAVRTGDNETARMNWQKLLEQNPPAEIRQVIANQLAALGVAVAPAAEPSWRGRPIGDRHAGRS